MSKAPLVSIMMPAKNAARWIDACLESIIDQDLRDWELVVIDDYSDDDTFEHLLRWADEDERIKAYRSKLESGIIPALKQSFDQCTGTCITRMDADDVMPKQKLSSLVELLDNQAKTVATGLVKYFSDEPVTAGYLVYQEWLNDRVRNQDHWDWIYRECVIASANWMMLRSEFSWERIEYPEDYALVLQWYARSFSINVLNETTHLWREHPDRTSRTHPHYEQQSFFELKVNRFLALDYDPNRPLVLLGESNKAKLTSAVLEEHRIDFTAINKTNLDTILSLKKPQILCAIFPPKNMRQKLSEWLGSNGFEMGRNYWWL